MTPKKKGHHVSKTIWQLRRKRSMIVKEPPVAFLPRIRLSTPELFAKVFTNERMGIEISRIVRIFSREESRSPQSGKNCSPLGRAQVS